MHSFELSKHTLLRQATVTEDIVWLISASIYTLGPLFTSLVFHSPMSTFYRTDKEGEG